MDQTKWLEAVRIATELEKEWGKFNELNGYRGTISLTVKLSRLILELDKETNAEFCQ